MFNDINSARLLTISIKRGQIFVYRSFFHYCISKKLLPILYSNLLYKMGNYFLDTRYASSSILIIWGSEQGCGSGRVLPGSRAATLVLNIFFTLFVLTILKSNPSFIKKIKQV